MEFIDTLPSPQLFPFQPGLHPLLQTPFTLLQPSQVSLH